MAYVLERLHARLPHPRRQFPRPLGYLPQAVPVLGFGVSAARSRAVARANREQDRFVDQR
jgi:hypothetical protein